MTPNKERCYYLAVKTICINKMSNIAGSFNNGAFHCLIFFSFLYIKTKLESHKKVCGNDYLYGNAVLFKNGKLLEFNQYCKCDKVRSVIYADLKSLIQ